MSDLLMHVSSFNKRILTLTSNDLGISWGPAIHFLELWNAFVKINVEAEVVGISPAWMNEPPIIEPHFRLFQKKVPQLRLWRQVVHDLCAASFIFRGYKKFDLIYLRLSHWHPLVLLAIYCCRCQLVVEVNGLAKEDGSGNRGFLTSMCIRWQESAVMKRASLIISVSDGISQTIRERLKPGGAVVTIKNGVASQFFKIKRANVVGRSLSGIYVGTFTPWDGADQVIALARSFPDVTFKMVGDGPGRASIEETAPENVIFTGVVPYEELPRIYSEADFGIVLYEWKRHAKVMLSSLKTLEYVASALPVFSTDTPGQQYIDEHGIGYLLQADECPREAFTTFLQNMNKYRVAYEKVRPTLVKSLGWERTARETLEALSRFCCGAQ